MSWDRKKPLQPGTKGLKRSGFKSQGAGFKAKPSSKGLATAEHPDAHIIDGDARFVEQTEDRHAARAARQMASARETRELVARVGLVALVSSDVPSSGPFVKEELARHEGYRRLVAMLPCIWCGIQGRSNHAHENSGKAKGMKVDDRRAMPLCVDDMGTGGCHSAFDQYSLIDGGREAHAELGRKLAQATRIAIWRAGKWPPNLPLWPEDLPLIASLQQQGSSYRDYTHCEGVPLVPSRLVH